MSTSKIANRKAYLNWREKTDTNEYYKSSFQKHTAKIYQRNQTARGELHDYIVRKYLRNSGWEIQNITPELIEIKRQQIILKRLIHEKLQ